MCNGGLFLFCVTVTQKTENAKFTGKELTKQIFPDILIKVGLKSHEKSEKTRYYFVFIVRTREKIQDNYMKYNGPCADTAGSAGEGLRKKGGTSMRKRNKVVSLLLAGCMAAGLLAGCPEAAERHR